ncbi:MAG: hypothetical protein COB02_10895 [Candidatus Cloacimonadota bacterium]|nr:MAG: hypothetical protein COB02_10895 [Candidatus Cloacimonadota bacterium]
MSKQKRVLTFIIIIFVWFFYGYLIILYGKFNDGGWYTSSAISIDKGLSLYKDFYFPHTPFYVYLYSFFLCFFSEPNILVGRFIHWFITSLLFAFLCLKLFKKTSKKSIFLFVILVLSNPCFIYYLSIIKSYSFVQVLLLISLWTFLSENKKLSYFFLGLASSMRISFIPIVFLYWFYDKEKSLKKVLLFLFPWIFLLHFDFIALKQNLYLPIKLFGVYINEISAYHLQNVSALSLLAIFQRKLAYLIQTLSLFLPFLLLVFYLRKNSKVKFLFYIFIMSTLTHGLSLLPYDEYHSPLWLALLFLSLFYIKTLQNKEFKNIIKVCAITFLISLSRFKSKLVLEKSQILKLIKISNQIQKKVQTKKYKLLCFDAYMNVSTRFDFPKELIMSRFSFYYKWTENQVKKHNVVNSIMIKKWIINKDFDFILLTNSEIEKMKLNKVVQENYFLISQYNHLFELKEVSNLYALERIKLF